MAPNERLSALREEYETGVNPVAFIPYAAALRGERLYPQAIDVCQKGLTQHPGSVAGRTLLGRLYCDIGSYEESRTILEETRQSAPDARGVGLALARTYVRMHELDLAEALLDRFREEMPPDPDIQVLDSAVRRLKVRLQTPPSTPPQAPESLPPTTMDEVLGSLVGRVGAASPVLGAVLVSLSGAFEMVRLGRVQSLREVLEACRETHRACEELEMGELTGGQFDFASGTILFACHGDELVMLCVEPSERMGPTTVAFERAVAHLFPPSETTSAMKPEIEA